jgi:hypothetical protein
MKPLDKLNEKNVYFGMMMMKSWGIFIEKPSR